MLVLVLLLWSAGTAQADMLTQQDFSGGLNTYNSSFLIQDNESPSLANVILDESGSLSKRQGRTKINSSALGDGGDDDVNAVYELLQADGDKFCVAFSSISGYYSTDGCQTFTVFIGTLTSGNDVNCDAYGDSLFCANNQYDMEFDGANDKAFSGPANADYVRVFRNRCFAAGTDATPARLYWSALANCQSWNTTVDWVEVCTESGGKITGLGKPLFDYMPVYCQDSTYLLYFDNANPSGRRIVTLSQEVGGLGHRTVENFGNRQYFASKGPNRGQPGVYVTDGLRIEEASRKLRNDLTEMDNFRSASGWKTIDEYQDWVDGNYSAMALSATRESGFMQSSYTARTDTLAADFADGTMVNVSTRVTGRLTMVGIASQTFTNAGGESNSTTINWVENAFLVRTYQVADCNQLYGAYIFRPPENNVGWKGLEVYVLNVASEVLTSKTIAVNSGCSPPFTLDEIDVSNVQADRIALKLVTYDDPSLNARTAWSKPFLVPKDGKIYVKTADSTCGDSTYITCWDIWEGSNYVSSGSYVSPALDTVISTPIWGPASLVVSSVTGGGVALYAQTSSDNVNWGALTAMTNGTKLTNTSYRYVRWVSSFTVNSATSTPGYIDSVALSAVSTGTWTSDELFLTLNMSAWGIFQTQDTKSGSQAAVTYAVKIATFAGGTASTGTIVVTPGSAISHSTGSYVVVIATYTVGFPTETAKTDTIVINWTEGASAKSATMKVFRNRLHACFQAHGGDGVNDTCYVLAANGGWTKWINMPARHLNSVDGRFMMGSSTQSGGGYLYKLYETDADDGQAIDSYWDSKDHVLTGIQNAKTIDRVFLLHKQEDTALTATLKADAGARTSANSVDLDGGSVSNINQFVIEPAINGNYFRMRFSNNAASQPWTIYGYGLMYRDVGLGPVP